jgi:hypothetical protein
VGWPSLCRRMARRQNALRFSRPPSCWNDLLPRWGETSPGTQQELKRREFDHADGSRPGGLSPAARTNQVDGFVSRQHGTSTRDAAALLRFRRLPCTGQRAKNASL